MGQGIREGEKPQAEGRACAVAQLSEGTCPLRQSQHSGITRAMRGEMRLGQEWRGPDHSQNRTVNLMEVVEA